MKNWQTSIATVSISGELETKLEAIANAGFTGYELFEMDLITSNLSPEDLKKLSQDLDLIPYLYQPFRDFEGVKEPAFLKNLERAKHKFELMNKLGIETILACSNVLTATENDDNLVVEQLGRVGDLANKFDIKVAYEALAWSKYINTYEQAWDLVKQVDHQNIGICLDSFHIFSLGTSLDRIEDIPGEKIFFLQLADAQSTTLDLLSWSRHHRLFPGEGEWDLKPFMQKILTAGYSGPVSIEVFNDVFRQKDPQATAIEAQRSLILLQRTTESVEETGRTGETSESSDAAIETSAVSASSPNQPNGFSFLELKTSAPEIAKKVLKQLGFRSTMVHKSRWAQVWSNENIHIIMRADSTGISGIFSLVGFGVDVEKPATVLEKAVSYHSSRTLGEQFFDNFRLEGLTSPSLEHVFLSNDQLLEALWSEEFIVKEEDASEVSNVSLNKVDHLAVVQPWEQLDETRLYYRNVFALETETSQFLPDSYGLVRSVSMHNASKGFRLALNAMPNSYYFQQASAHGAANHIAFDSSDIVSDLTTLVKNGLAILKISKNYYEDLQARFGFTEEFLAKLQELNVLYDRDQHGEFLHAYTPVFGNVFFEFVQRIDGYDGYGSNNAAVRMAAARQQGSAYEA